MPNKIQLKINIILACFIFILSFLTINFKITQPLIYKDVEKLAQKIFLLQEENIKLKETLSFLDDFDYLNTKAKELGLIFPIENYYHPALVGKR